MVEDPALDLIRGAIRVRAGLCAPLACEIRRIHSVRTSFSTVQRTTAVSWRRSSVWTFRAP